MKKVEIVFWNIHTIDLVVVEDAIGTVGLSVECFMLVASGSDLHLAIKDDIKKDSLPVSMLLGYLKTVASKAA